MRGLPFQATYFSKTFFVSTCYGFLFMGSLYVYNTLYSIFYLGAILLFTTKSNFNAEFFNIKGVEFLVINKSFR